MIMELSAQLILTVGGKQLRLPVKCKQIDDGSNAMNGRLFTQRIEGVEGIGGLGE